MSQAIAGNAAKENVQPIDCELTTSEPTPKKPRLSLSLKKKPKSTNNPLKINNSVCDANEDANPHRFGLSVSEVDLTKVADGVVSENTKASTQWAERNFNIWILS